MHEKMRDRSIRSDMLRKYWDERAQSYMVPSKCSIPGLIVASYLELERKLIMDLSLSYLMLASRSKRLLLLKSDLWNEGINSLLGHIYDLLDERKRTIEIVGIDVSTVVCNSATRKMSNEGLKVACADVRKLPFGDGTFDAIMDVSTLDHIYPTHIAAVIHEYERALKEGGILTLIFDWETFWKYLVKIFNRVLSRDANPFKFWWRLSPNWIEGKLGESGFTTLNGFPLGILSLSLFFLKTSYSGLVGRIVCKLLYNSLRSVKFMKALRYIFPFSSQYFFIAKKQRTYGQDSNQRF